MYTLMVPFTISRTTLTRNVKESKWNLLKRWGLKTLNFGNVPKNIHIYIYIYIYIYIITNKYITNNYIQKKVLKSQHPVPPVHN